MTYSRVRARSRRRRRSRVLGDVVRVTLLIAFIAGAFFPAGWIKKQADAFGDSHSIRFQDFATFSGPVVKSRSPRVVYPYSVVPGGVASGDELKNAADHDSLVAEHYKGFDYQHARVVEVTQPKLVYVSYRRGGQIFWSSKQASLHPGEKLITDGHMTARTRCGNQVSVLPQVKTGPEEPSAEEMDRPDALASGMQQFPSKFDSSILNIDPGLPVGPTLADAGHGVGPFPGGFMPLPIGPGGVGTTVTPPPCTGTNCNPPPPPPPPPPPVPEPTTLILAGTGAAAIWARLKYRR